MVADPENRSKWQNVSAVAVQAVAIQSKVNAEKCGLYATTAPAIQKILILYANVLVQKNVTDWQMSLLTILTLQQQTNKITQKLSH